jgi:hypothetical protein
MCNMLAKHKGGEAGEVDERFLYNGCNDIDACG